MNVKIVDANRIVYSFLMFLIVLIYCTKQNVSGGFVILSALALTIVLGLNVISHCKTTKKDNPNTINMSFLYRVVFHIIDSAKDECDIWLFVVYYAMF